jgi:hypothetical protein
MRTIILIIQMVIFTASALMAQKGSRTCKILFLDAPVSAPKKLFMFDGESSQEVDLPRLNLSQEYKLASGAIKVRLLPTAVDDEKDVPVGAPEIFIPESMGDCYLLVKSDPSNKIAPVKMFPVNVSKNRFKNGQMFWINLTEHKILAKIGLQKFILAPRTRRITDAPASTVTSYPAKVEYQIKGETVRRPIFETQWQHNPRTRMVLFVFNKGKSALPRVMGFSDFRVEKEDDK